MAQVGPTDLFSISVHNRLPFIGESSGSAIFSGRREGFTMYFARLIRPHWNEKTLQGDGFGGMLEGPQL